MSMNDGLRIGDYTFNSFSYADDIKEIFTYGARVCNPSLMFALSMPKHEYSYRIK